MFLSLVLVYACYLFLFVCATLCLATGIYYIAELVEEYPTTTKKVIRFSTLTIIAVHVLIMVLEDLPLLQLIFSIFAQLVYSTMLKEFPAVDLLGWRFIASCVVCVVNHVLWFQHFTTDHYPFDQVLAFFVICVWLIPFGFFVSISGNEYSLPTSMSSSNVYFDARELDAKPKKKANRILSFFTFLKQKKSDILPSSIISINQSDSPYGKYQ